MKKIFALILCLMLIAVPISAYAEGETEEINTEDILPEESPAPAPKQLDEGKPPLCKGGAFSALCLHFLWALI